MEVPQAYKQTSIGITSGWVLTEFSNLVTLSKKKYTPKSNEVLPCIELEHFNQETGSINGWTNSNFQKSTKNVFEKGDVLFGKLRPYLRKFWLADFDGVCSSEVWVLKSKEGILPDFLYRIIQSNRFIQIANVSSGSKMPRADWDYVSEFPFPIPPLHQQQKIAEILSTWDTAIEICRKTIEQLKQRNKGLAQQLLSGKKRIKGFNQEWREHILGEFIEEHNEKPKSTFDYLIFTSSNKGLMSQADYYSGGRMTQRLDVDYNVIPPNHITYRSRSDDGLFTFNLNSSPSQGLISGYYPVFKIKNGQNLFFIKYLNFYKKKLTKYSNGTSQLVLSIKALKGARFSLPENEEQIKIIEVLQIAEDELIMYQSKLKDLNAQKKGLMQQLLTGKVRTI